MVLMRIVLIAVVAVAITAVGVMSIGLEETIRYGLIGLAGAGVLLAVMWLAGRSSSSRNPAGGGASSKPKSKNQPKG